MHGASIDNAKFWLSGKTAKPRFLYKRFPQTIFYPSLNS